MDNKVGLKSHIRTTLSVSIVAVTMIVIIAISIGMYIVTSISIRENVTLNTQTSINQINYDLEYYIQNVETIITGLEYSIVTDNYFSKKMEKDESVSYYLRSLIKNRDDVINIFLIRPDGNIISNDSESIYKNIDFTNEDYYTGAVNKKDLYVSTSHVQSVFIGKYSWVVSCSKAIYDEDGGVKGVIVVDLNFKNINDMISRISLLEKGYIFVVAPDGSYVYHPKLNLIYSGILDEDIEGLLHNDSTPVTVYENNEKVEYISVTSDFTSWKTIGKIYSNDFNAYLNRSKKFFTLFVVASLIILIIVSFLISERILKPIKTLVKGMLAFREGALDTKVEVIEENEFGLLTDTFNKMTKEIKMLVETNIETERKKRKSDFKLLQSQINPHFLYNTLDSIVWMGETGKNKEVVVMTSSLAKMFRLGLNKGEEFTTIENEIEHIDSYLTIQKMRYSEKLNYKIICDESLKKVRIIKILLQPIVENAIYHGIKNIPVEGYIEINIYKDKFSKLLLSSKESDSQCIYIEVQDNGPGIEDKKINKIISGELKSEHKGSGIGVKNVNERIKMYYGNEYGLSIESELYEGVKVIIKLPFEEVDVEEK